MRTFKNENGSPFQILVHSHSTNSIALKVEMAEWMAYPRDISFDNKQIEGRDE